VRRLGALLILSLGLLVACSPAQPESTTPQPELTPQETIERAADDALGSSITSVSVEYSADSGYIWRIEVDLGSVPDTATIDKAAAGILAAVASQDASPSPARLQFKAKDLRLPGSAEEWGALGYEWSTPSGDTRGDVVTLSHTETYDPNGGIPASIDEGNSRGEWRGVDGDALAEWAKQGTPDL